MSDKMKARLGRILASTDISNSTNNRDYNAESGTANDEIDFTNAHHDYGSYNTPTLTKQPRTTTSPTATEWIKMSVLRLQQVRPCPHRKR